MIKTEQNNYAAFNCAENFRKRKSDWSSYKMQYVHGICLITVINSSNARVCGIWYVAYSQCFSLICNIWLSSGKFAGLKCYDLRVFYFWVTQMYTFSRLLSIRVTFIWSYYENMGRFEQWWSTITAKLTTTYNLKLLNTTIP